MPPIKQIYLKDSIQQREGNARARGRHKNIFISETQYRELQSEIPDLDQLIEDLSDYMQSTGKSYADHAATLRRWSRNGRTGKRTPPAAADVIDYDLEERIAKERGWTQ